MKLKLAASVAMLALPALAPAAEVYKNDNGSFEVFGRVKANLYNNDADSDHRLAGTARLGVKGDAKVMDNFSVFGYLLYDLAAQETQQAEDRLKVRYGYVGFDLNYAGKFSFGRFENAYYKVTAVTDLLTDWGKTGVSYWGLTPNDFGGRLDGQAMYDFNLNGWFLALSYNFKDESKHIERGWAASTGYEFQDVFGSPLGIMTGYSRYEGLRDDELGYHADGYYYGADKTEFAVSAYYGTFGAPGFYAAAVYNHGWLKNTYLADGVEVSLAYTTPGSAFTFLGTYGYLKNQRQNYTRFKTSRLSNGWSFNVTWSPVSNFNVYSELEHRVHNAVKNENETLATLGLIYNF
ncbi:MAG: porin [Succinivibrionaceae bacterium]|nr:porin [Succinivibrionaceae bacterium]